MQTIPWCWCVHVRICFETGHVISTGAIELSVFSEHFETEIDVVDVQTQRIDKFGKRFALVTSYPC